MNRSLVFGLLAVAALVIAYFLMHESEKRSLSAKEQDNFLAVDSGLVDKISVRRIGTAVDFQKQGEEWKVLDKDKAYKTEKGAVEPIANLAHFMKVGDIISSNPDKQMLFQVDTLMGYRVSFNKGETELASVIVGKMGPDYQSTYVRKPNSNDVYMAIGNFARYFTRPASGFRDHSIAMVDTNQIAGILVKGKDIDYRLVHVDSMTWRVETDKGAPFEADGIKLAPLLRQLSNLRCSNFYSESDSLKPDFSKPAGQLTLSMKDGTMKTFQFAPQGADAEPKSYFVRTDASDETFIIYSATYAVLIIKPDDLKHKAS